MSGTNELIIAAAGSGKTELLVDRALKVTDQRVLITTFTEANGQELVSRLVKRKGYVPKNIVVQTWFSFLLQHGVRPFQDHLHSKDITGLNLIGGRSAKFIKESDAENFYFDRSGRIYNDKISQFLISCNFASGGRVVRRLSRIYSHIFVDEVQDLAGHDLEVLKLLIASNIHVILVGDPRQATYATNQSAKNRKFAKSEIVQFFDKLGTSVTKDDESLNINYRCGVEICALSNSLYPGFSACTSGNKEVSGHDGVFLVKPSALSQYLSSFNSVQLRDSKRTRIENEFQVMNFGESKGLTFDRVLIYPTEPIVKWLKNRTSDLATTSRAKLYVAITRARFSVAFVFDYKATEDFPGLSKF